MLIIIKFLYNELPFPRRIYGLQKVKPLIHNYLRQAFYFLNLQP